MQHAKVPVAELSIEEPVGVWGGAISGLPKARALVQCAVQRAVHILEVRYPPNHPGT
jgi:hypothetical protein